MLETYLQSTIMFSHVMLLDLNTEEVNEVNIDNVANQFVQGSEHCLRKLGKFTASS